MRNAQEASRRSRDRHTVKGGPRCKVEAEERIRAGQRAENRIDAPRAGGLRTVPKSHKTASGGKTIARITHKGHHFKADVPVIPSPPQLDSFVIRSGLHNQHKSRIIACQSQRKNIFILFSSRKHLRSAWPCQVLMLGRPCRQVPASLKKNAYLESWCVSTLALVIT